MLYRHGNAPAVQRHVLVRRQRIELPGVPRGRIQGRGLLLPRFPAIVMAGPSRDHRLTRGEGRRLLVAPVAGEQPRLHAMVRLSHDQKMSTVLLEDHCALSSLMAGATRIPSCD